MRAYERMKIALRAGVAKDVSPLNDGADLVAEELVANRERRRKALTAEEAAVVETAVGCRILVRVAASP